jgi:hypothetical protein
MTRQLKGKFHLLFIKVDEKLREVKEVNEMNKVKEVNEEKEVNGKEVC